MAERYLARRGWQTVVTNWEGGGGELDLVARRRGILAIVEVKTRSSPGELDEPLRAAQRERIVRATAAFIARRSDLSDLDVRFDLITVDRSRRPARVNHLPSAFEPRHRRTA